ncbi:aldehyde dehydrogenase family protein [Rhodococcoides yunnanense]|uniref:aldehyde dehydrogenase family protein n=1 Tax=Rhodococcoides yunnanense TaxID=278209 RepID=UPI000A03A30F|nr:aldehyde dehydrogenase family protein [Rhodococcus yunnanensis]
MTETADEPIRLFDRYFEEYQVGEIAESGTRTITAEDIDTFAHLTGDHHPAHTDADFATPLFGGVIAHGVLTFGVVVGLTVEYNRRAVAYGYDRIRFPRPVSAGTTIRARSEVVELSEHRRRDIGLVTKQYTGFDASGATVLACRHTIAVDRRSHTLVSDIHDPVETALAASHHAFERSRTATPAQRAAWLRAIADGLDGAADELVAIARRETHLTEGRLRNELVRTSFQARLFADRLDDGTLFDTRIDLEDPAWPMGARPDIRRGYVPIGPVLVFAASNFPFAFSTVGGDTVSALAAGCSVVVKAHSGHLELSRRTAEIVVQQLHDAGAPDGLFTSIEGQDAGTAAVQDRRIKAVGFTGSEAGGRALFDLAVARPDPIPFYGELGSTNPVVVTEAGWAARADDIATGFAASFTMGSGQFCTQPGVILVPDAADFVARLTVPAVDPMLNERIADGYERAVREVSGHPEVTVAAVGPAGDDAPSAHVLTCSAEDVLGNSRIVTTEMFGPASVVVEYRDSAQALDVLRLFDGVLTATVQGGEQLDEFATDAVDVLGRIAGRVIWNQWPTGVTVSDAQQHGGPWPATTAPTTTSVGTAAASRFVRPIAYQNMPVTSLPQELMQ